MSKERSRQGVAEKVHEAEKVSRVCDGQYPPDTLCAACAQPGRVPKETADKQGVWVGLEGGVPTKTMHTDASISKAPRAGHVQKPAFFVLFYSTS